MTTRNPSIPEDQYQHLLDCRDSGQIPESAWQEHLKDKGFREWVEGQTEPSKEPEPLRPEVLCRHLRVKAQWLDREAADRIDSDTAIIRELVAALELVLTPKPNIDASHGPCCSDFDEDRGVWFSTGCSCGNYDDAALAQSWRDEMNAYARQATLRELLTRARKRAGGA